MNRVRRKAMPKHAEASPQARHHFTLADQVDRLVTASEAVARLLTLCSLPRTNPGGATR